MSTTRHHHSRSSSTIGNDDIGDDDKEMEFRFIAPRNGDGLYECGRAVSNIQKNPYESGSLLMLVRLSDKPRRSALRARNLHLPFANG
ncbi:hypothetical protein LguiB_023234 [Lonicera macranthoides]